MRCFFLGTKATGVFLNPKSKRNSSTRHLLGKLETVAPQYVYVLELTEFFNDVLNEGLLMQTTQSRIRDMAMRDGAGLYLVTHEIE